MRGILKTLSLSALCLACAMAAHANGPLTFEERVKAQEAIERVYYQHRIWPKENPQPKPPFEQMVPREVIEAKVTDYLKKSAALDKFWQRPLTGEQLQAEMDRMAKGTKDPATLKELFAALHDDPTLIAECLARPVLADRLIHNWYAFDTRFHGDLKSEAQSLRDQVTPANFPLLDAARYHPVKIEMEDRPAVHEETGASSETTRLESADFDRAVGGYPETGVISQVEESAEAFIIRWTESKTDRSLKGGVLVFEKAPFDAWFKHEGRDLTIQIPATEGECMLPTVGASGTLADPTAPDSWKALWYVPDYRVNHTAVWTGTEMIVWGGLNPNYLNSGGRYTPSTDVWAPTSTDANCPSGRAYHAAVWTGTEMIIWGGANGPTTTSTGGRYTPSSDSWTATSTGTNCPSGRYFPTAVWTGSEMIVWGGWDGTSSYYSTGGRYTPPSNTWTATSTGTNCPSAREDSTAIWTGTEMIVWGGYNGTSPYYMNTGGRYTPSTNTWTATSIGANCPAGRYCHTAIWTGTEMIIWGGDPGGTYLRSGGRYSPSTDSWLATSTGANCPSVRSNHSAVWTGSEMIVWGGQPTQTTYINSGGRYNPSSDSWTATSTGTDCPSARTLQSAVWTGTEMIVWGGDGATYFNVGGRYAPSTNSWVATSTGTNSPSIRQLHSAVWTGTEMIVWGGNFYTSYLNTGGRYTPSTDSWTATSIGTNCPIGRQGLTAVWTGTEMIVWGGYYFNVFGQYTNTGGRYVPSSNSWTATSTGTNCPSARGLPMAVWTGTEMVIWGGYDGATYFNNGGRYAPSGDTWTATSTGTNCPSSRSSHTAVWTGTEMIVWGGYNGTSPYYLNTGGRYTPASDSWIATSTGTNCPSSRSSHAAVWTGTEMIVWGGYNGTSPYYLNTGGRYTPASDSWTPTPTGAGCPSARFGATMIWTGTEMVVWGGAYYNTSWHYYNTGGRYTPSANSWAATPNAVNCPSGRNWHTGVWTGEEMIVWDGFPETQSGGIFYPNTPPRSLPVASTSLGGDATFTLGAGETLTLDGSASTDGSNPYTTTPYHDKLDSIVSYEWDLNGDANFGTQCSSSSGGVDLTGATPSALSETSLASFGISAPGTYTIWLRVTDELGVKNCNSVTLTIAAGAPAPGEASRSSAMQATQNGAQVHVTYAGACSATGHAVYWGDLAQVSAYAWSGSQCVSGAGAIDFTPPAGDIFFAVVGNDGLNEGNYGKDSSGVERPKATGIGACNLPQHLAGSCDP